MRGSVPPVEACIALAIVRLAAELARGQRETITWRHPIAVSAGFGLLHGLGFASALADIGLPQGEVATALLFFNVGIELGQVLFIACLAVLATIVARALRHQRSEQGALTLPPSLQLPASYLIGTVSTYWMLDRLAGF